MRETDGADADRESRGGGADIAAGDDVGRRRSRAFQLRPGAARQGLRWWVVDRTSSASCAIAAAMVLRDVVEPEHAEG